MDSGNFSRTAITLGVNFTLVLLFYAVGRYVHRSRLALQTKDKSRSHGNNHNNTQNVIRLKQAIEKIAALDQAEEIRTQTQCEFIQKLEMLKVLLNEISLLLEHSIANYPRGFGMFFLEVQKFLSSTGDFDEFFVEASKALAPLIFTYHYTFYESNPSAMTDDMLLISLGKYKKGENEKLSCLQDAFMTNHADLFIKTGSRIGFIGRIFPDIILWPRFYLLLFFVFPVAITAFLYHLMSIGDIYIQFASKDEPKTLERIATVTLWISIYFFTLTPMTLCFKYFETFLTVKKWHHVYHWIPIAFYLRIHKQMGFCSVFFLLVGCLLFLASFQNEQEMFINITADKHLENFASNLSLSATLASLLLLIYIGARGLFYCLSIFELERVVIGLDLFYVSHFVISMFALTLISLFHKITGTCISVSWFFLFIIPKLTWFANGIHGQLKKTLTKRDSYYLTVENISWIRQFEGSLTRLWRPRFNSLTLKSSIILRLPLEMENSFLLSFSETSYEAFERFDLYQFPPNLTFVLSILGIFGCFAELLSCIFFLQGPDERNFAGLYKTGTPMGLKVSIFPPLGSSTSKIFLPSYDCVVFFVDGAGVDLSLVIFQELIRRKAQNSKYVTCCTYVLQSKQRHHLDRAIRSIEHFMCQCLLDVDKHLLDSLKLLFCFEGGIKEFRSIKSYILNINAFWSLRRRKVRHLLEAVSESYSQENAIDAEELISRVHGKKASNILIASIGTSDFVYQTRLLTRNKWNKEIRIEQYEGVVDQPCRVLEFFSI